MMKRKAEVRAKRKLVKEANLIIDQLATFPEVKTYHNDGFQASIECKNVKNMDNHDLRWAFNLTKQNMKSMYQKSDWGWNDKEKKEEMFDNKGWYVIARNEQSIPIGMASFRFDIEERDAVVYCYEIQISQNVRGKGLGKYLMNILKLIAQKNKMNKVMLTVFKHNEKAYHFFTNVLGFQIDEISPSRCNPKGKNDYCYEILSIDL